MKFLSNLFILFFYINTIFAQDTTKVVVDRNFDFKNGIFLNFDQVKNNKPILLSNIITPLQKSSADFYEKLFAYNVIVFIDNFGLKKQFDTDNIWGYAKNGKLFINWEQDQTMIPIVGTISHFIASHIEYDYNSYDPYSYYNTTTSKRVVTKQYVLFFPTGQVFEFNYKNLDYIFSLDQDFYLEWSNLSKRKKKKLMFVYLRKFNQKYPLMLPN